MSAYVIVDIEIQDAATYEQYRRLAPATISLHRGRYLARGGETRTLEGDWSPRRLVILEFPGMQEALTWWGSPEYRPVRAIRERCARSRMVAIEGLQQVELH